MRADKIALNMQPFKVKPSGVVERAKEFDFTGSCAGQCVQFSFMCSLFVCFGEKANIMYSRMKLFS